VTPKNANLLFFQKRYHLFHCTNVSFSLPSFSVLILIILAQPLASPNIEKITLQPEDISPPEAPKDVYQLGVWCPSEFSTHIFRLLATVGSFSRLLTPPLQLFLSCAGGNSVGR